MEEFYSMSNKEITRLEILQRLLQKKISQIQAGELLNISTRQIRRILRNYHQGGVAGLISKKRGKPSNNRIADTIKQYAISLIKQHYVDFGPTLAAEKLLEKHELKLSVETIRMLMVQANIWTSKTQRSKRSYQPRYKEKGLESLFKLMGLIINGLRIEALSVH